LSSRFGFWCSRKLKLIEEKGEQYRPTVSPKARAGAAACACRLGFTASTQEWLGDQGSGRVPLSGLISLIGEAFPREQRDNIPQCAQVAVRPITALLAPFLQVLLFRKALWRSMGNPLTKFSAAVFYLAKFYAFI